MKEPCYDDKPCCANCKRHLEESTVANGVANGEACIHWIYLNPKELKIWAMKSLNLLTKLGDIFLAAGYADIMREARTLFFGIACLDPVYDNNLKLKKWISRTYNMLSELNDIYVAVRFSDYLRRGHKLFPDQNK
jgi:hypothetical protein